jgi:hypothetical protein
MESDIFRNNIEVRFPKVLNQHFGFGVLAGPVVDVTLRG